MAIKNNSLVLTNVYVGLPVTILHHKQDIIPVSGILKEYVLDPKCPYWAEVTLIVEDKQTVTIRLREGMSTVVSTVAYQEQLQKNVLSDYSMLMHRILQQQLNELEPAVVEQIFNLFTQIDALIPRDTLSTNLLNIWGLPNHTALDILNARVQKISTDSSLYNKLPTVE